jgi:hypothetical protein
VTAKDPTDLEAGISEECFALGSQSNRPIAELFSLTTFAKVEVATKRRTIVVCSAIVSIHVFVG